MKKVKWNERAREFVRGLDDDTKIEIGTLLMMLQAGESLGEPQSKPMKSIPAKAHELRVKDKKGAYRVIYVLSIKDQILIPRFHQKDSEDPTKRN